MLNKLKQAASRNSTNILGFSTNRKIIVIESDDWGSIRMPSIEVYNEILGLGIQIDRCPYNRYDSLANEDDLSALFEVLMEVKDKNGNYPRITANTVMANPDFKKIKESSFKEYYYETFTTTLKKYPNHDKSFEIWKQGMNMNLFHPQFHGREHVNIPLWLSLLQKGNQAFIKAFESEFWGLGPSIVNTGPMNIQASFDSNNHNHINNQKDIIKEGLDLFEKTFKFKSKSFIANNFIWDPSLNKTLSEKKVNTFQGMKYQKLPILNLPKRQLIKHNMGDINKLNQVYLKRNCRFEPSQFPETNSVESCLFDISNAFFWKKPAIINSHRLNFIGNIVEANRSNNLKLFSELLKKILKKWPDVEFMTSDKLGELIINKKISKI